MTARKFKITTSLGVTWLTPANGSELIYKWEKISSINFVKKLQTKLTFRNDTKQGISDFTFLYEFEKNVSTRCENILCEIFKICNGVDVLEYKGEMPLNSGDWDLDQCKVTLELRPIKDVYTCINDKKKDVTLPYSQFTPFNSAGPGLDSAPSDFYLYDYVAGEYVFLNITNFNVNSYTFGPQAWPYGSSGEVRYPHALFASVCYQLVKELLYQCGLELTAEAIRSDFFDWNAKGDTAGYIPSAIPKLPTNLPSTDYPNPTFTYDNRFLFLPKTPGINYFTGQTNRLTHLLYLPKSNVNDTTAATWEEPSTPDGELNGNAVSFEDIELIWKTVFDAHWFIDTDGCMRVEHISWFNNTGILYDSTIPENQVFNESTRKYNYKDELLPRKEIFLFSANRDKLNGRVDFYPNQNNEILYESICVISGAKNEEKSYAIPFVCTDLKAINSKNDPTVTEFYDTDGINLFVCEFGTTFDIRTHVLPNDYKFGQIIGSCPSELLLNSADVTLYENGHLQWANLIRRYLKYGRVLTSGINGSETIAFNSRTVKTKQQVPVFVKMCCDDDEFQPNQAQIKTLLGIGDISEAEYNTKTNLIKIKPLHD